MGLTRRDLVMGGAAVALCGRSATALAYTHVYSKAALAYFAGEARTTAMSIAGPIGRRSIPNGAGSS